MIEDFQPDEEEAHPEIIELPDMTDEDWARACMASLAGRIVFKHRTTWRVKERLEREYLVSEEAPSLRWYFMRVRLIDKRFNAPMNPDEVLRHASMLADGRAPTAQALGPRTLWTTNPHVPCVIRQVRQTVQLAAVDPAINEDLKWDMVQRVASHAIEPLQRAQSMPPARALHMRSLYNQRVFTADLGGLHCKSRATASLDELIQRYMAQPFIHVFRERKDFTPPDYFERIMQRPIGAVLKQGSYRKPKTVDVALETLLYVAGLRATFIW